MRIGASTKTQCFRRQTDWHDSRNTNFVPTLPSLPTRPSPSWDGNVEFLDSPV